MVMRRRCPRCATVAAASAFAVLGPPRLGWGAHGLLKRRCPQCGHVGAETRAFPLVRAATGGTAPW
ncbi:MAG TPA: hypothetical protein VII06_33315 [Chloroflexota bacterium]|jgi:ribosomal protein S27AE